MVIEVKECECHGEDGSGCPFYNCEMSDCQAAEREIEVSYGHFPKWCPLFKEEVIIKLKRENSETIFNHIDVS